MVNKFYIKVSLIIGIILSIITIGNSQTSNVQCILQNSYPFQSTNLIIDASYRNYSACNNLSTLTIHPHNASFINKYYTPFCVNNSAYATLNVNVDGVFRFSFDFDDFNNGNVSKQLSIVAGHHTINYEFISGVHVDVCFIPNHDEPNQNQYCQNGIDVSEYCLALNLAVVQTPEKCTNINTGTLTASAGNSAPNNSYSYKWYKNNASAVYSTSNMISGLSSLDVYSVVVTDAYGRVESLSGQQVGLNIDNFVLLNAPPHACYNGDPITLGGLPNGGTFSGDGVTGNQFIAKQAGVGTHTLTYHITPPRPTCRNTQTRKILVLPPPRYINRVISATATTLSDSWPTDFTDAAAPYAVTAGVTNVSNLYSLDYFSNGNKGIWRSEESYVYVEDRKQTDPTTINPNVKISLDGVYDTLPLYLYQVGDNSGCYPGWRKMNTVTKYNPHSYEIENKDILNRRTAALYGYYSTMPVATATNASETEIAFNGFEEYDASNNLYQTDMAAGNLSIYNNTGVANQLYKEYEVTEAYDNQLILGNITDEDFAKLSGATVNVWGAPLDVFNKKNIAGSYAVTALDNSTKTATLAASFPYSAIWRGKISFAQNVVASSDISNKFTVSNTEAHTGQNSLFVTNESAFEQYKMKLIPAGSINNSTGEYVLSAWIKSSNPADSLTYVQHSATAGYRGIYVVFMDVNGNNLSASATIEPSGRIIDGWQKMEGTFTVPPGTYKISLVIRSASTGSYGVYFDDIRIYPLTSNMQTYVYNKSNYKISAVLDNNNYATLYHYDEQGNLFLVKKETEKGIQTIQEFFGHQHEK